MKLNKENFTLLNFNMETLIYPQIELEETNFPKTSLSEIEMQFQLKKENSFQKQIHLFKENIFFNNFPYEHLTSLDLTSSHIPSIHSSPFTDFNTTSIDHLQYLRNQYMLKHIKSYSNESSTSSVQHEKEDTSSVHKQHNTFITLIDNLITIIKSTYELELKQSIINRLLCNMNMFFKSNFSSNESIISNEHIECKLLTCIELYTKTFIPKLNNKAISLNEINCLITFQNVSLYLKSFYLFYKITSILHELTISINNHKQITSSFFKQYLSSSHLFHLSNSSPCDTIPFDTDIDINTFTFITKNNFLYLLIQYKSSNNIWNLYKLKLSPNNKYFIYKETHIYMNNSLKVKMTTSPYSSSHIVLCAINNEGICIIMNIDKNTLKILSKKELQLKLNDNMKVKCLFATSMSFIAILEGIIYEIDYMKHSYICYEYKWKDDIQGDIMLHKGNGIMFNDEYVYIMGKNGKIGVYNINKRRMKMIDNVFPETYSEGYYDDENGCIIISDEKNKQITFRYYKKNIFNLMIDINRSNIIKEINNGIINCCSKLKECFNNKTNTYNEFNVNDYLIMNDYFNEYNTLNKIDYIINSNNSDDYYYYFIFLLTKICIYYGNSNNNGNNTFLSFYNNKDFLHEIFTLYRNTSTNSEILILLRKCYLIIMKSIISSLISKKTYTSNLMNELNEIFEYFFNNINTNIENDIYMEIVSLLSRNISIISKYTKDIDNYISNTNTNVNLKLVLLTNKLHNIYTSKEININTIETCLKFEIEILFHKDKYSNYNSHYLHNFQQLLQSILIMFLSKWNCTFNKPPSHYEQLFISLLTHFSSLIETLISSSSYYTSFTYYNSILCLSTFCAINYFITTHTSSSTIEYTSLFTYISLIKPIYYKLNILYEKCLCNTKTHNLINEQQILLSSEHPCEFDKKKCYDMHNIIGNENEVYVSFDPFSRIKKPGRISYDSIENGKYNKIIPMNVEKVNVKTLKVEYISQELEFGNVNDEEELSYGFDMKIENYNEMDNEGNIIFEINRVIVYSIGYLMKCIINHNDKNETNKEDDIYQIIINSTLFENITFDVDSLSHNSNELLYDNMLIIEKEIDGNYIEIKNKIVSLFNKDNTNNNETSSQIISKLYPDYTKDINYKTVIDFIHKQFLNKNVWGSLSDKTIHPIIIGLFTIILKKENLLLLFDSFINNYIQSPSDIENLPNYNLFYTIYKEVSSIKKYFTQKQKDIAEEHNKQNSINNKNTNIEQLIQNDINTYKTHLKFKIDFILPIINIRTQITSNIEYNNNIKRTINNVLTFIQNDKIDISILKNKLISQNKYAYNKYLSFHILNIFLNMSTLPQNIKDLITHFNQIHNNKSSININYFTHDIYGANSSIIHDIKLEIYSFQMYLIQKLKQQSFKNISTNLYDIPFYILTFQSLIYPFNKTDFPFLFINDFFSLFNTSTIISEFMNNNNITIQTNITNYTNNILFNYTKVNYDKLYAASFTFYTFITYTMFDILNEYVTNKDNDIINENDLYKSIYQVFMIIIEIMKEYINRMRAFIKSGSNIKEVSSLLNEEKLNSFLHILYRSLTLHKNISYFFYKQTPFLLSYLFEILLFCCDKNKLICINIISLFLLNSTKTSPIKSSILSFLQTSFLDFQFSLETHHYDLYTHINIFSYKPIKSINNPNRFFIMFLFTYISLLQQNNNHNIFYKTDIDFIISYKLLNLLRNIIIDNNNLLSHELQSYSLFVINNYITIENPHFFIVLLLYGFNNDYKLGIGSNVLVTEVSDENDLNVFVYDEYVNVNNNEISTYNEWSADMKHKYKKGIVIGFCNENKQIFETCFNNDVNDILNCGNEFEKFQYSIKKYAFVVLDEDINKENVEGMLLKPIIVETKTLVIYNENPFLNKNIFNILIKKNIISFLLEKFDLLSKEMKYIVMTFIRKYISVGTLYNNNYIETIFTNKEIEMLYNISTNSLDIEHCICSLEELEMKYFKHICSFQYVDLHSPSTSQNNNNNELSNIIKVNIPEHQGDIFLTNDSFYVKFNENLIKEFKVNIIYNISLFMNNNKFFPFYIFDINNIEILNEHSIKQFVLAMDYSLFNKNNITLLNKCKNTLKCIITNDNIQEYKLCEFPIVVINMEEYVNLTSFLFEQNPNEEYQNFFMESLQKDFTMLLDIPIEMITEAAHLSQRDLILNVLNESIEISIQNESNNDDEIIINDNNDNNNNDSEDEISFTKLNEDAHIIKKMNSLIARRLFLMLITHNSKLRHDVNIDNIITLLKLLLYEMNVFQLHKGNYFIINNDIVFLIKNFLHNISLNFSINEYDNKLITKLLSIDFLRNTNHIECSLIENLHNENELISYDNIENTFKIIFALLPQIHNSSFDIYNYEVQLFASLLAKSIELIKTSSKILSFIFELIFHLLKEINIPIQNENNSNIKLCIRALNKFQEVVFSQDISFFINKAEQTLSKNEPNITELDLNILKLTFMYYDLAFNAQMKHNLDLKLESFFDLKVTDFYFNYSLLSHKKLNDKATYLYFLQKLNLIPPECIPSKTETINFHYYDKSFTLPHLNKISFTDKTDWLNLEIKVKHINSSLLNTNNCIFIYNDNHCKSLQSYIRHDQKDKSFYIQHQGNNEMYISFPYSKFKTDLFGCGGNEKQSLGCEGDIHMKYITPQKCVGLESVKNIIDFKFGYYHTFVTTIRNDLFTCGSDSGSSFKTENHYGKFSLQTHFQELVQKEGITGIWVNNYNASILVTKENNIYGCGVNNEYCLTDKPKLNEVILVPIILPPLKQKVLKVACGFKSTFFIVDDGSAYTVGSNTFRQCGSMEEENCYKKYFHLEPPPHSIFRDVVAGEEYFLMLIDEPSWKGRLYSLGSNEYGRAGVGRDSSNRLQKCKGVEHLHFKIIASRNEASAAITVDGFLYTFGYNGKGALGQGNVINYYQPTIVESVKDKIIDSVGISHNHMVIVGRNRKNGKREAMSCGTHEYKCLGYDKLGEEYVLTPKVVSFFGNKDGKYQPIEVSVSRFQTFFMTMMTNINKDLQMEHKVKCAKCKNEIGYILHFYINNESNYVFLCENCITSINEDNKKQNNSINLFYCVSTPYYGITDHIEKIKMKYPFDIDKHLTYEQVPKNKLIYCSQCKINITKYIYISEMNPSLRLCYYCLNTKIKLIEYPQLFYITTKNYFYSFINTYTLSPTSYTLQIYPTITKSEDPYISLEITKHYSNYDTFKHLNKDKHINEIYSSFWKHISKTQLTSLNLLKHAVDKNQLSHNKYSNYLTSNDPSTLYNYLKSLTDNTIQYESLLHLNENEISILHHISSAISDSIYKMLNTSSHNKYETSLPFYQEVISDYIEIINSKERVNLFTERLEKMKINVRPQDKEISINRHKAARFYSLNKVDTTGENTVFGQFYHKMKTFPIKNYLSQPGDRIFAVKLLGEGSSDYGGPYNEILSIICKELQSHHLDLFIKTPNNKHDIGSLRDKYIPNPSATSVTYLDMFHFIGCLFGHIISSGHLLPFNFHPLFWTKVASLSKNISFNEIESIDKHFYKHIISIENFPSFKTQNEFESTFPDLTFTISLSNDDIYELIPKGKETKVTLSNKNEYVRLAKKARIEEFDMQVRSIRTGLLKVIPYTELSLLMGRELELLVCGEDVLDVGMLQQFTEYSEYSRDDEVIGYFWKALKEFTSEERECYIKYVWGRTRLPDPNVNKFTHVIARMRGAEQDKRLPTATTCYFTLKLPNYSSYDILKKKLKYVIMNCAEIDTDFNVNPNEIES